VSELKINSKRIVDDSSSLKISDVESSDDSDYLKVWNICNQTTDYLFKHTIWFWYL